MEDAAEQALSVAMSQGSWLILEEIHMVAAWLPRLKNILAQRAHADFRCILIATATESEGILTFDLVRVWTRVVYERPVGVKKCMQHAWAEFAHVDVTRWGLCVCVFVCVYT